MPATKLRTKGERTRFAILETAAALASEEGLEPLSIGRLAEATGLSKSGLFAHFGAKEELQLATVDHAARIFGRNVIAPAQQAPEGVARLWALCDHMLSYSERQVFPGGCFFAATATEFKNRPGAVKDRIAEMLQRWISYLEQAVREAQEAGQLDPAADAGQLAFELNALAQAANANYQLFGDARVFAQARAALRSRLDAASRTSK